MSSQPFPRDFLWGASTASHQVEGGTDTDWDRWEKQKAATLPQTTKRLLGRLPNWPEVAAQANTTENYISGPAVDHYNRYSEDFGYLEQLHMNSYRFSLEWARIEPQPGQWNMAGIGHYRRYLQVLHDKGITPFVTLWHFTLPRWFADKGGFTKKSNIADFLRYVEKVTAELGDLMPFVSPINEPSTYVMMGYVTGLWPPQRRNLGLSIRVYRNLMTAHAGAYHLLKKDHPDMQVGSAVVLLNSATKSKLLSTRFSLIFLRYISNWWFLDNLKNVSDFIGLNHYMTNYHAWYGLWLTNPPEPRNDLGWYMEPAALQGVLQDAYKRYKLPIYILENGLADKHDRYRQWWIDQTIIAMQGALANGVDLRGYHHWSLLDNFEWSFGWLAEFGLVHVDRTTMERTLRPSAVWFGEQIARHRGLG